MSSTCSSQKKPNQAPEPTAPSGRAHLERSAKTTDMHATDLFEVYSRIHSYWDPYITAELNGQLVKCAKLKGEFVWHKHDGEDELFLVHRGILHMRLRDCVVTIGPGQLFVVPRGVEHQPYAPEEVEVVLFEPASTLNTGNVRNALTKDVLKHA